MKIIKPLPLFKLCIIIVLFITYLSCNENVNNSNNELDPYEIKVWDYSDNHYFLDTVYKSGFLDYYNNINISSQTENLKVDEENFEVWIQTDVSTINYRKAGVHIDLPVLQLTGYNDSLKTVPTPQQGIRTFGIVRKLERSAYVLNKYAGYISLKVNIPDNYFAAVAYKRTLSGEQTGTISTDSAGSPYDTLVLKMIKVQNLVPSNSIAWELKLKNIYSLPKTNIIKEGFEFRVNYLYNGVYMQTLPITNLNTYLITILGLDKYTNGRTLPPDSIFDYIPGITIDPENGWIIFPTLKPFVDKMESYHSNGLSIDPVYWYPQIYQTVKSYSNQVPNANNYKITGFISR